MATISIRDCDIIFLSYDEPNADVNYQNLLQTVPNAKRVHGVEGSDSAHKKCAEISDTEHFLTIDGDTVVQPEFFDLTFTTEEYNGTITDMFSWCGKINVNGLMYGNGSIKLWTREIALSMRTHENADPLDPHASIDFCYDPRYKQLNANYSTSVINATPAQAWRAGFREGVKMTVVSPKSIGHQLVCGMSKDGYKRLLIWTSVGRDVKYGEWAMLGAREGAVMSLSKTWDTMQVRDFKYLTRYWEDNYKAMTTVDPQKMESLLTTLRSYQINITDLSAEQSIFFKETYTNPARVWREYKMFVHD